MTDVLIGGDNRQGLTEGSRAHEDGGRDGETQPRAGARRESRQPPDAGGGAWRGLSRRSQPRLRPVFGLPVSTTVRGRISAVLSHPVFDVLSQRPQCHTTLPSRPCKPSKLESNSPERAVKRKTFVRPIVTSLTFKETEVTRKTTQRH